ncbi:hypothetical protein HPB52_014033 [Rhipicephalus sanguineus]|uniref:Uncharacterized protein n=1 Tax=Rhipicephalus sanguineus TaxID=34632 RepID=A0A9D4PWK7_RHISA|nr:hypothetical protein HPB52_014033 [Rhipicephalus sanguineus]
MAEATVNDCPQHAASPGRPAGSRLGQENYVHVWRDLVLCKSLMTGRIVVQGKEFLLGAHKLLTTAAAELVATPSDAPSDKLRNTQTLLFRQHVPAAAQGILQELRSGASFHRHPKEGSNLLYETQEAAQAAAQVLAAADTVKAAASILADTLVKAQVLAQHQAPAAQEAKGAVEHEANNATQYVAESANEAASSAASGTFKRVLTKLLIVGARWLLALRRKLTVWLEKTLAALMAEL